MEDHNKSDSIKSYDYYPECRFTHDAISVEKLKGIIDKIKYSIFRIRTEKKFGTGFLCKIPLFHLRLPVLITCNHVLDEESLLKGNVINLKNENMSFEIKKNKNRKYYTSEKDFDATIIEIIEQDIINEAKFLDVDNNNYSIQSLAKYNAYLFHYDNDYKNLLISFASFKNMDGYRFYHYCNSEPGSSGGPIFSSFNNRVYGIHLGSHKKFDNKVGTKIEGPIMEFQKKYAKIEGDKNEKCSEINKKENGFIMSNENKADMIYNNEKTLPNEQKIDFEGEKNNTKCACSGCSIL